MAATRLQGSFVALITPFTDSGKVDEAALRALVDWHVESGTAGLVPCGTTGESATLSHEEHLDVLRIVVEQVDGKVPVIAGTGSNATWEAIELTKAAEALGVTASLQITPYYNKPTQAGLIRHFEAIADATNLPLILYNVPSRTAVNLRPETVAKLAKRENVIGIKEACGDLEQIARVRELCGDDFLILSGEDAQNVEIMALGGRGAISVTANVVPQQMAKCCEMMLAGRQDEAAAVHKELMPLHQVLFVETNPIPVKTALAMMGRCAENLRLPLCNMAKDTRAKLQQTLQEFGLL